MLVAGGLAVVQELHTGDPQRIGPYRLLGRLGAGGMGRVFLGRSAGGRLVAVKVIRPELADDPEFRARFGREVAAAKKVSGLFTAPVVDADLDGPMPWLATAYVAGPSLADALTGHGPLPAASVLALAAGLAEGLSAIHAAGVVHRDLKPSNVLLAEDGPRVIDFGISQAAEASALTNTDLVVGSPGFMSPEQAEGREVGPPSDVFSLGAVLAFAATGEGPFGAGSTAALVYRVVHGPPGLDHVPAQVRPLIRRCLAKDACRRPATAELLAELGGADLAVDWLPAPVILRFPQPSAPGDAPGGPTTVTAARLNQSQQVPGQPQQARDQPQQAPGQPHRAPGQPQAAPGPAPRAPGPAPARGRRPQAAASRPAEPGISLAHRGVYRRVRCGSGSPGRRHPRVSGHATPAAGSGHRRLACRLGAGGGESPGRTTVRRGRSEATVREASRPSIHVLASSTHQPGSRADPGS